jgi:hypothetical protein
MNQQPQETVGMFWAILFVIGIIYYAFKEYNFPSINISDKVIIGYFTDYEEPNNKVTKRNTQKTNSQNNHKVTTPKRKTQKQIKITTTSSTTTATTTTKAPSTTLAPASAKDIKLYNDCLEAMISLGWSRTYSRQVTKETFDKYKITSIQQFINIITNKK